jgi:hypothetical protein
MKIHVRLRNTEILNAENYTTLEVAEAWYYDL